MPEIQTFEAPEGVLAYLFLQNHRAYAQGDIVGLKVATGDQLAETYMTTQKVGEDPKKTAITRRATAHDLLAWKNRHARSKSKAEPLVAVEFETDVGTYRGPGAGRKADIAGFPAAVAAQYVEGFLEKGRKVGKVAHYYVAPKNIDTELETETDLKRPRTGTSKKMTKRRRAALGKSPRTTDVK